MPSPRRRLLGIPILAALLFASGCGSDATPKSPTPSPSAAAASRAASSSAAGGAVVAFTGDPVAHATAMIKLFERGAAKDQIKTQPIAVVLVTGSKECASKSKPFSGAERFTDPLDLCLLDKPYTMAVSATSYPDFAKGSVNAMVGLLLRRWATGVVELNVAKPTVRAVGCIAGATVNGLKDVLSPTELNALVAMANKATDDYANGFDSASDGVWQRCKAQNIVR